jgi:hypothetical protein
MRYNRVLSMLTFGEKNDAQMIPVRQKATRIFAIAELSIIYYLSSICIWTYTSTCLNSTQPNGK